MVNDEFDNMDIHFMKLAIGQAKKAAKINEVPIGCVIVYDGKIIGRGYNRRNTDKTTLGHAEITAIKKASRYMQGKSHRALAQSLRLKVLPVKLYDAVNGKVWW